MLPETIVAVCSMASTTIVGFGLWKTWRRNGTEQRERDKSMAVQQALRDSTVEQSYQAIAQKLDNPKHGLEALDTKISNLKEGCIEHTTSFEERIQTLERG